MAALSNFVWVNRFNKRFKETEEQRKEREAKEAKEAKEKADKKIADAEANANSIADANAEREKNKKKPVQIWIEFTICFFLTLIFGIFQFSLFRTYLDIPIDVKKEPYISGIPYKWAESDSWFGKFFGGTLINCWRDLRFALQKYFMIGNKIKTSLAPDLEGNEMLNIAKGGLKFWVLMLSAVSYFTLSILFIFSYLIVVIFQTFRGMFAAYQGKDLAIGLIGVFFAFWPFVIFTYFIQILYVFFLPIKTILDGTFMKETTNAFKAENRGGQLYQFLFWMLLLIGIICVNLGGNIGLVGSIISFVLLALHILFMVLNFSGIAKKITKEITKAKKQVIQENKMSNVNLFERNRMRGGRRKKK